MGEMLIAVLFWLFIPLSLLVSAIGVSKSKYGFVILDAVLLFRMAYILNGSPFLHGYAIHLPLFQLGSATVVKADKRLWAWLLLLPAFFAVAWLAGVTLLYHTSRLN